MAKGGYQIVDLSKVTIGTETKVDGVYKTISGFDGKPVFIITPNTSGVFAEFTKNSGMYIGAYIGSNSHLFTVSIISSDQVTITDKGPAGGGGTSNYNELSNKPAIAGTTLIGDKSLSDLGIQGQLTEGTNITIDEHNNISANIDSMAASNVTFDNTSTGLAADDVQGALTELNSNLTNVRDYKNDVVIGTFGTQTLHRVCLQMATINNNAFQNIGTVSGYPVNIYGTYKQSDGSVVSVNRYFGASGFPSAFSVAYSILQSDGSYLIQVYTNFAGTDAYIFVEYLTS